MSHTAGAGSGARGPSRRSKVGALLSEYYNLGDENSHTSQAKSEPAGPPQKPSAAAPGGSASNGLAQPFRGAGGPAQNRPSGSPGAEALPTGPSGSSPCTTSSEAKGSATASPRSCSRGGDSRMLSSTGHQTAAGAGDVERGGKTDLDSENFDVHAYFASAVQTSSLRELLRRSVQLEEEVRRFEGELQTLVYENYGKFLDAAETVRCVKEDMQALQEDMGQLDSRVDAIEGSSRELDELVRDRAASIEELVSFRQLLDKLQILFTFPEVLRRHLANGDAETVLSIYLHIHPFLQAQQKALPRLQRLQLLDADATSVFRCAKKVLRQRLEPPSSSSSGEDAASLPGARPAAVSSAGSAEILSSKDASKILMLLLEAQDEGRASLLQLYHRSRTHALIQLLQLIFEQDRLQRDAAAIQQQQDKQTDASSARTAQGARGSATSGDSGSQVSGSGHGALSAEFRGGEAGAGTRRMLEVACSSVSEQLMGPLVDAVHDTLVVFRWNDRPGSGSQKDDAGGGSQQTYAGRGARPPASRAKPEGDKLSAEDSATLQGFLMPVLRSVFARVLALLASTNPPAASVVSAVDSLRVALRRLHAVLPADQQQLLAEEFVSFSDQLLQQEIALAFRESYLRAAEELGALQAFCHNMQAPQLPGTRGPSDDASSPAETAERRSLGGRGVGAAGQPLDDSKTQEALQQLARTEHAVLLQGCLTLTDAHQLVNGVCGVKSAQAERLVRTDIVAWTEGFFSLVVKCLLRLTRDTPTALQERVEQRVEAEELREDELAWREHLEEGLEGFAAARYLGAPSKAIKPRASATSGKSSLERQITDAVHTAIFTYLVGPGVEGRSESAGSALRRLEGRAGEKDPSEARTFPAGYLDEGRTLFCLLMMRMGRHLELQGLGKVAAVAVELFPSFPVHRLTASSAGPLPAGKGAPERSESPEEAAAATDEKSQPLLLRTRWASQAVLTTYVYHRGLEGAALATAALRDFDCLQNIDEKSAGEEAAPPPVDDAAGAEGWVGASGSAKKSPFARGLTAQEQQQLQILGLLDPLLQLLQRCDAECAKLLGERRQGAGGIGSACVMPGTTGAGAGSEQTHQRRMARLFGRRRTAIEKEMERLFARKQAVFAQVPFSRAKAVMGIFRIASRALVEDVRSQLFSRSAVRQLQLECAAASEFIRDLVAAEDGSVVDGLLDEITASATARCIERAPKLPLLGCVTVRGAVGVAAAAAAVAAATGGVDPDAGNVLLEQAVVEDVCNRCRGRYERVLKGGL